LQTTEPIVRLHCCDLEANAGVIRFAFVLRLWAEIPPTWRQRSKTGSVSLPAARECGDLKLPIYKRRRD